MLSCMLNRWREMGIASERTVGSQQWRSKKAELEGRREQTPTVITEGVRRAEERNDDEDDKGGKEELEKLNQ